MKGDTIPWDLVDDDIKDYARKNPDKITKEQMKTHPLPDKRFSNDNKKYEFWLKISSNLTSFFEKISS